MTRQDAYARLEAMKVRSTTPVSKKTSAMRGSLLALAILMAASSAIVVTNRTADARDYNAEIQAVQQQIDQYNAQAAALDAQANTLQNQVALLNSQKAAIQAQLDLSQAKYDQLVAEIAANEKKIADNQKALGVTMANMYVATDISPLEMLASSNNIADYIDKQTQRSSVRDSLSKTITEIKRLKAELEQQQIQQKQILDDQTNQRDLLASKQAEQQKLLDDTQGQEAAYQQLSAAGTAKRQQLESEQQAEIAARYANNSGGAVAGDPSKGGYPSNLANAPLDSVVDPWGMYNRECVSYVAWKVYQSKGYMPYWGGRGNANQWPGNARAMGIQTGSTPRAGSAGVMSSGAYGHIVWVESVNSDGTINISQYNELLASGWGQYSERYHVNPSVYDTYIYF